MTDVITGLVLESGLIIWACWIVWSLPEIGRVFVLGKEPAL